MRPSDVRVLFLGGGDLGTGAAHQLVSAGLRVGIVELATPLAVRRAVAFAEAARAGTIEVEGVRCVRVELESFGGDAVPGVVPLCVAPIATALGRFTPQAVVDARMQKRPLEIEFGPGIFRVALGPGHVAGADCDAVVETLRGPDLGRVVWQGSAAPDTRVPGEVGGEAARRVLRAPVPGVLRLRARIGERVAAGAVVADVEGHPVASAIAGLVRGLLADGDRVDAGQKLGDIDPRPDAPPADRISDKSRQVGTGVLTAIATHFGIVLPGSLRHPVDGGPAD